MASARSAHSGHRHRLTRASRRLWPVLVLAAMALGAAAWVGLRSGPDWLYRLAQAEARAGRFGRAAAYLGWLDRLRSPTPYVRLLRAQVAGAQGQTDAAVAELSAIPDSHVLAPLARLPERRTIALGDFLEDVGDELSVGREFGHARFLDRSDQ